METSTLTKQQLQEFQQNGFFIVENLLDHEEIQLLRDIARADQAMQAEAYSRADGEGGAVKLLVQNEITDDTIYGAIVRSQRIVDPMEQALGDEVYHYHHKMILKEPDSSGRRKPVPTDEQIEVAVDTVVVAIGNGPNPLVPQTTPGLITQKHGRIVTEKATGKTNLKGVFAGGDIVLGAATVIMAMGAGRTAARSIHEYLSNGIWIEPKLEE